MIDKSDMMGGQMSLFGPDTWCGKTSPARSAVTADATSNSSSRKSSESQSRTRPMCLCLTRGDGLKPDACMTWAESGLLHGAYTTRSFGESPSEENASRLPQILEVSPHPKYCLSAKACLGILKRAERRGKELPPALRIALEQQSASRNEPDAPGTNLAPTIWDARGNGDGEIAPTITGDHQNRVTDYTAVCIGNGQADQLKPSEQVGALNCMHDQQAVITYDIDRAAYNQGQNAQYDFSVDEEQSATCVAKGSNAVFSGIVRRLTPTECERLQGFDQYCGFDGWTDIGDWVDSKGKKHKPADSPRYKALGNSIALPFWAWLARRICAQYDRPMTMASLFDGIGGFPLVFTRAGCKPVWASEIEEFPIAVTKKRFPD